MIGGVVKMSNESVKRETVIPCWYTYGQFNEMRYFCPVCNAVLYEGDTFCPTCLRKVSWAIEKKTSLEIETKKRKRNVKAIETVYRGYRFRSRLEARWAVFFDAIGAEWEYEPEGFVLSDGTKYLPDFLLHNVYGRGASEIYIEIKGVLTDEDLHKISKFSFGSGKGKDGVAENPIIIFGKIPEERWIEGFWSERWSPKGGIEKEYNPGHWCLDFGDPYRETHFYDLAFSDGDWGYYTEPVAKKGGGLVLDYLDNPYDCVDRDLTFDAYKKARQARFEYGENKKDRLEK